MHDSFLTQYKFVLFLAAFHTYNVYLPLDETARRTGGDWCRPALSAELTAFAQEVSDNIVVKVCFLCALTFPPFQIGCSAGVYLT